LAARTHLTKSFLFKTKMAEFPRILILIVLALNDRFVEFFDEGRKNQASVQSKKRKAKKMKWLLKKENHPGFQASVPHMENGLPRTDKHGFSC